MRPGQNYNNNNNKNRNNRNRNRRPGGGGGQTGGNGANRVYDSNGPDVKLRGTAQTIAEKYMQLARDAQSSGDNVAAEGYYQFADHYYRVWLAAQPVGQPIQFSRRSAEDEYDEDGNEIVSDTEAESQAGDGQEGGEAPVTADGGEGQPEGEPQGYQSRQNYNRNDRPNNNNANQNRDGGNGRNFKQRWPRRNERYNQEGQANGNQGEGQQNEGGERQERFERPVEDVAVVQPREVDAPADSSNWEAPSFLTRPTPIVAAEAEPVADVAPAPRPRGRKPRVVAPVEEAPQGE